MYDKYYYCDLLDEQIVYEELLSVIDNEDKELDKELKKYLDESPQIRYYAKGKSGLRIDVGILRIVPKVFVKRLVGKDEAVCVVFEKKRLK